MKVILLSSVGNLGMVGDVVNVKPGYARNFLFPRKHAVAADSKNLKAATHQKVILEHKLKRAKKASEEVKKALEKQKVTIRRKAGENEKLFGSVNALDIEQALKELGATVSRRAIHLDEPIKKAGIYQLSVKLDGGLEAKINLEVAAEKA